MELERLRAAQPAVPDCDHCGGTGDMSGEYPGVSCPVCDGVGKVSAPSVSSARSPEDMRKTADYALGLMDAKDMLSAPVSPPPVPEADEMAYLLSHIADGHKVKTARIRMAVRAYRLLAASQRKEGA